MARTQTISQNYDYGIQADSSRDQLGKRRAYRLKDWIPQNNAPLRKRGGYGWASKDLGSLSPATYMAGVGWTQFAGDEHLIAISESGKVYKMTSFTSSDGAFVGATSLGPLTHRPIWFKDRSIILQGYNASVAAPWKYYNSAGYTVAALGGTPPQARVGMAWGDYLLLANGTVGGTAFPKRVWPSAIADSETWTTGTAFFDAQVEVVAMTQLRSLIVILGFKETWVVTGDTPPPGGNLAQKLLFSQGCIDPRSLINYRDSMVWANLEGIWKADGAGTLTDLTEQADIADYYRSLVQNFKLSTGWTAAAGLLHNVYFLTILDNSGTYVTSFAYDLERQLFVEHTNLRFGMYAERPASGGTASAGGFSELFGAHRGFPRAGSLSSLWLPDSTNTTDADSTAVLPQIEGAFSDLGVDSLKRFGRAYVSYDIRDPGGVSPYLKVDVVTTPESTSYVTLSPTLPATTKKERKPVMVAKRALGVGFRITQVGQSSDTRLYGVDVETHAIEPTR